MMMKMFLIILVWYFFRFQQVECQMQQIQQIKISKYLYFNLPQIDDAQYSVVKQMKLGNKHNVSDTKKTNHFVKKLEKGLLNSQQLRGKDIFTRQYLRQKLQTQQQRENERLRFGLVEENSLPQYIILDPSQKIKQEKQETSKDNEIKEQIIEQKSNQLYIEFKNLEIIKQKNLHNLVDKENKQYDENVYKFAAYVGTGLILAYVIIKKATKKQVILKRPVNEQRKQLRLKDTCQQDDDVSSSESD